jgi:hypothetical protein
MRSDLWTNQTSALNVRLTEITMENIVFSDMMSFNPIVRRRFGGQQNSVCCFLLTRCFFSLRFDPEDGRSMFLINFRWISTRLHGVTTNVPSKAMVFSEQQLGWHVQPAGGLRFSKKFRNGYKIHKLLKITKYIFNFYFY